MEKVILLTSDGSFVTSGQIPAFKPPPDVLLWGDRVFQYDCVQVGEMAHVYVESFFYALVTTDKK